MSSCSAALCRGRSLSLVLVLLACMLPLIPGGRAAAPCPPGCEKHGTCNLAEGRCVCPWGYTGRDCRRMALSACRATDQEWPPLKCGYGGWPKSCECYRQCKAYFEEVPVTRDMWPEYTCFERDELPPEQQTSVIPTEDEPGVSYYKGWDPASEFGMRNSTWKRVVMTEQGKRKNLPLSACPDGCNGRGTCAHEWGGTSCFCYRGHQGKACEVESDLGDQPACLNRCLGRGTCIWGFCKCQPGYFGVDCSRTKAYSQNDTKAARTDLAIYVYDLPPPMNRRYDLDSEPVSGARFHIYLAFLKFTELLMQDADAVTENPWEANLFFVPIWATDNAGNVGNPADHARVIFEYLAREYPFWNRTGGRDHFIFLENDVGAAELPPQMQGAILITHFCHLGRDHRYAPFLGKRAECYHPAKDVCAAPFLAPLEGRVAAMYRPMTTGKVPIQREFPLGKRRTLMFFAGDIRNYDMGYSGGVRQKLVRLHRAGGFRGAAFRINPDPPEGARELDYWGELRNATFCVSPAGHGWGIRMYEVMAMGCIPVIVQEHIRQAYEDLVPYHRFSLRLRKRDLDALPAILGAVSEDEISRLQHGLIKYHRAFMWEQPYGLAYNYTIAGLRRALQNVRSRYYEGAPALRVPNEVEPGERQTPDWWPGGWKDPDEAKAEDKAMQRAAGGGRSQGSRGSRGTSGRCHGGGGLSLEKARLVGVLAQMPDWWPCGWRDPDDGRTNNVAALEAESEAAAARAGSADRGLNLVFAS